MQEKNQKMAVTDGQGYPEAVIGNSQAVKSEPGDAGDRSFRNAVNFACSLQLDDRNFLVKILLKYHSFCYLWNFICLISQHIHCLNVYT